MFNSPSFVRFCRFKAGDILTPTPEQIGPINAIYNRAASITEEEIQRHYQGHDHVKQCATVEVQGGIKGHCPGMETAWLFNHKASTTAN